MSIHTDTLQPRAVTRPRSTRKSRSHSALASRARRGASVPCTPLELDESQRGTLEGITPRYPNIRLRTKGFDGNALSVVSAAARAMKAAGGGKTEIDAYYGEALAGDYEHVLRTTRAYVNLV